MALHLFHFIPILENHGTIESLEYLLLKYFNILDSTNVKVITSKHFMIDHMVVIYLLRILKQILQRFLLSLNDDGNSNSTEVEKLNYD